MFLGNEGNDNQGLLYWCGAISEKNDGQLKRICGSVLSVLRTLLTLDFADENIFLSVFVTLPIDKISQIHFAKHILPEQASSILSGGKSKSPTADDACEILSILMNSPVNDDSDDSIFDIDQLLNHNTTCKEFFMQWLQRTANEEVIQYIILYISLFNTIS